LAVTASGEYQQLSEQLNISASRRMFVNPFTVDDV